MACMPHHPVFGENKFNYRSSLSKGPWVLSWDICKEGRWALVWRWAFICDHSTIAHNLTKLITSQYTSFDLVPKLNSCTCHQIHDILSVKCQISEQTFLSYDGQDIDLLF